MTVSQSQSQSQSSDATLPVDPILVRLLEAARLTNEQIIYDHYGFNKTYPQLLADIIATRDALRYRLPASVIAANGLLNQETPYVAALTNGGYEFIVSFFAIRALGGACFPFSAAVLPEEACHYLSDAKAVGIIAGAANMPRANDISKAMNNDNVDFVVLQAFTNSLPIPVASMAIDTRQILDPQGPGVVMCTSGTTGIPKAAILPRQCLVQSKPIALGRATLSYRPPHWRGGFASAILPVLSAHKLYSLKLKETTDVFWEVLRNQHITLLIFNPVLLRRMKEIYEEQLIHLDENVRLEYIRGFKNLGRIRCSGAFLSPSLLAFYTEISALPFKNAYGSAECGGSVTEVDTTKPSSIKFTVGRVATDHPVEVKLSNGTHGEFLVKTPWMMKGYIGNQKSTAAAFEQDGYLKTGDIGHVVDGEYVFHGRANDDFIGRIPRIPVEFAINNLPYIAEAHVLLVPDYEERAVCGALIRLKPELMAYDEMTIERLHQDLSAITAYMRPYLLRVINDDAGEEIPYTASQKPNKPEILRRFFCVNSFWQPETLTPYVQVWPMRLSMLSQPTLPDHKPWDFASW